MFNVVNNIYHVHSWLIFIYFYKKETKQNKTKQNRIKTYIFFDITLFKQFNKFNVNHATLFKYNQSNNKVLIVYYIYFYIFLY